MPYTITNAKPIRIKQGVAYGYDYVFSSAYASDIASITLSIGSLNWSKEFSVTGDTCRIELTMAETKELETGIYYYTMDITYADGESEEKGYSGTIIIEEPIDYDYDEVVIEEEVQRIIEENTPSSDEESDTSSSEETSE